MRSALLTVIGVIYAGLGLWCTLQPQQTAQALGLTLSDTGLVEYLVVYGGLEIGLGIAMITGARRPHLLPGVFYMTTVFSVILPVFRSVLLLSYPANASHLIILGLELVIAAALLIVAARGRS